MKQGIPRKYSPLLAVFHEEANTIFGVAGRVKSCHLQVLAKIEYSAVCRRIRHTRTVFPAYYRHRKVLKLGKLAPLSQVRDNGLFHHYHQNGRRGYEF
jgi:hypothetical protein